MSPQSCNKMRVKKKYDDRVQSKAVCARNGLVNVRIRTKHALKAMVVFGVLVSVVALRTLLSSRLVRHCCRHHYYIIVACEILLYRLWGTKI